MSLHYKGFPLCISSSLISVNMGPMQLSVHWRMTRPGAGWCAYQVVDGARYLAMKTGCFVLDSDAVMSGLTPLRVSMSDFDRELRDAWWNMSHDVDKDLPPMGKES